MDLAAVKERLIAEVDRRTDLLIDVSHQIHARPELGFEEHFAHGLLADAIEADGLTVERGAYGVPTAFAAHAGTTGPLVAVLCEYDALPGLGHACGHNIIAAAGLGAGLAAAALAEETGGRVVILGTPAEEGGGGKVVMLDRGAFAEVDAAVMVHPAGLDLRSMSTLAITILVATYTGRSAHAAAAPQKGRNALDAAVLGYMNIAALRQHIRPEERVHGVFHDAGVKPNIVPERAVAEWYVRARDVRALDKLKARVLACLQAGADAAGCEVDLAWQPNPYADVRSNEGLLSLYEANSAALGRPLHAPDSTNAVAGSTDMGNVSYEVPGIHPMIQVAPPHISIHTPEFATYAMGPDGDRAVLDGARAMAMTVADVWLDEDARLRMKDEFAALRREVDGA